MATPEKKDKMYVRPTPEARHALKTILVSLQSPKLFGPDLTQEDFVCATWLWMAGMAAPALAAEIAPHIEALRAQRGAAKGGAALPATDVIGKPGMESRRTKRTG